MEVLTAIGGVTFLAGLGGVAFLAGPVAVLLVGVHAWVTGTARWRQLLPKQPTHPSLPAPLDNLDN